MADYKLFDSIQEVILVIDKEGKTIFGNEAAGLLFEIAPRRFASKKPLSQFVTLNPDPFTFDLATLSEPSQMKEVTFESSGGKSGTVQVIVQPQPDFFASDEEGKGRFFVSFRDVSLEKVLQGKYRGELDQKEVVIQDLKAARSKLEDYSKNLENMVAERTLEITKTNALLRTILDSLGQGILVFDAEGKTLPIVSQVGRKLFGEDLQGRMIEDVLGFKGVNGDSFAKWRTAVFEQMLDFSDLAPLAPSKLILPPPTEIALSYNRMAGEDGSTAGVVVVTTDRTAEVEAVRAAQHERALVKKIVQVAKHKDAFRLFIEDAQELIGQFLTGEPMDQATLERKLHTLKGGAATFALDTLTAVAHSLEDFMKSMGGADMYSASFKMRMLRSSSEMRTILDDELRTLEELLGPLHKSKATLKVDDVLKVYSSSMVDLANRLGKKMSPLNIEGGAVVLPTTTFQALFNSFVHAFRNAIDHGLEKPDKRVALGKTPEGHLSVSCSHLGDNLIVQISDDGRGVNVDRLREKLRQDPDRAHLAAGADFDVVQAILEGNLSTTEVVSDISGRGVGLSAVTEEVRKLGGEIRVDSVQDKGMTITMIVPYVKEVEEKKKKVA